jgi:hypothetical protein
MDPENKGGEYRSDGVDIEKCTDLNGGYAVFDIQDGEWLAYTVNVDSTALYRLKVRLAVEKDGGAFSMKLNDKDITGTITIPPTMGPALWNTVTLDSIELAGGEARFVFEAVTGGFLLNYIDVLSAGTGSITREWWDNVGGTTISDIPTHQRPSGTNELSLFECPTDWGDDYAQRVRGYLYPQTSGDYTFWIASDDASELWLSTDDAPNNKVKLCSVSGWVPSRAWDQNAEQKSAKIKLTAGHKYYIEALHKEGSGGDNLAVAWSGPDIKRDVIAGQYLAPYEDKFCDLVLVDFVPTYASTENQYQFTFTVTNASSIATPKEIPFTVHIMLGDKVVCGSDLYYTDIAGWTTFTGLIHEGVELQDGVHELTAVVDLDNDVTETDEANNYKSKIVMVGFRQPENPDDVVQGMYYEYFLGAWSELPDFDTLTPTATGVVDNFDISPRTRDDNFAFRFLGYIQVPDDGEYTFYTASDDGSKLYIGDLEVVNNDGPHGVEEKSGSIPLKAGVHAITVTFFEAGGGEDLFVSYEGPSVSKQNIPNDVLYVNKVLADVKQDAILRPQNFALYPNAPNPFNPTTRIQFDIPKAAHVSVGIYNVLGQRVRHLIDDNRDAGQYSLTWDGLNDAGQQVTSGVYVMRLHSENVVLTQKMVLVR